MGSTSKNSPIWFPTCRWIWGAPVSCTWRFWCNRSSLRHFERSMARRLQSIWDWGPPADSVLAQSGWSISSGCRSRRICIGSMAVFDFYALAVHRRRRTSRVLSLLCLCWLGCWLQTSCLEGPKYRPRSISASPCTYSSSCRVVSDFRRLRSLRHSSPCTSFWMWQSRLTASAADRAWTPQFAARLLLLFPDTASFQRFDSSFTSNCFPFYFLSICGSCRVLAILEHVLECSGGARHTGLWLDTKLADLGGFRHFQWIAASRWQSCFAEWAHRHRSILERPCLDLGHTFGWCSFAGQFLAGSAHIVSDHQLTTTLLKHHVHSSKVFLSLSNRLIRHHLLSNTKLWHSSPRFTLPSKHHVDCCSGPVSEDFGLIWQDPRTE